MALQQKDKELVAIGASIGAGCSPCLEHHIPAGRNAGLTEPQLSRAIEVAEDSHRVAVELLSRRSRELLHEVEPSTRTPLATRPASRADELVALGTSVGTNCHLLLRQHISGALGRGLEVGQVRSAVKMAEIVQNHAAEITAKKAASIIEATGQEPATVGQPPT